MSQTVVRLLPALFLAFYSANAQTAEPTTSYPTTSGNYGDSTTDCGNCSGLNDSSVKIPRTLLKYPFQVHACLQMIGWCVLAAIGFFMEVHFPVIFVTPRGRQFRLPNILQLASVVFALTGIIYLIVVIGWNGIMNLHKLLGFCAMILRIVGAIMMCFSPRGNSPLTKCQTFAKYARIVFTRGSFLLAIVTVYTGLNVLFLDLDVPLSAVILLSILIVVDILFELILFIHAHLLQSRAKDEERQQLLASRRDSDNEGSGEHKNVTSKTSPLTKSKLRVGMTILYILIVLAISTLIIVWAIYFDPKTLLKK